MGCYYQGPLLWILALSLVPEVYSDSSYGTFVFNISQFDQYFFDCGNRGSKCQGILQYCDEDDICQYCTEEICRISPKIGQCQIMCRMLDSPEGVGSTGAPGDPSGPGTECSGSNDYDIWEILAIFLTAVLLCTVILALLVRAYRKGWFKKDKPHLQRNAQTQLEPILSIPTDHHLTHPADGVNHAEEDQTGLKL